MCTFIYLCANYFRVHDVANSDDAYRLHYDDGDDDARPLQLQLLLPVTNPFGPSMLHFHFLNALRALHVSYFPIVRPRMLGYYGAVVVVAALLQPLRLPLLLLLHVAIENAVVDPVFVAFVLLFVIAPNAQLSDVGCDGDDDDDDEAPEIQEISFVDSNATMVADSNAEYLSALFMYLQIKKNIFVKI